MPETGYFAVFLIGLLGGVHCIGMCGGIVSALSLQMPGAAKVGAGLVDTPGLQPRPHRQLYRWPAR
jgi:hypothetical protein